MKAMSAALAIAALTAAAALHVSGGPPGNGAAASPALAAVQSAAAPAREPDVIFVPTPQPVVEAMLKLANVGKGDVLYDLGSGDGRIPITAARTYGIRAVGIDIDPERISEAKANARAAGVSHLVTFRQADLFQTDFSEANVVTLYLLPSLNEKLRPKLQRELKPGSRIVSHAFEMGAWKPQQTQQIDSSTIYLWRVGRP